MLYIDRTKFDVRGISSSPPINKAIISARWDE